MIPEDQSCADLGPCVVTLIQLSIDTLFHSINHAFACFKSQVIFFKVMKIIKKDFNLVAIFKWWKAINIFACFLWIQFSGCSGMGAKILPSDRSRYNIAIQESNKEQLLLNLARLKYRDAPFFLEVKGVAAQFSYGASVDSSNTFPESGLNIFGLSAGATIRESPTVIYAPLQGEKFKKDFYRNFLFGRFFFYIVRVGVWSEFFVFVWKNGKTEECARGIWSDARLCSRVSCFRKSYEEI